MVDTCDRRTRGDPAVGAQHTSVRRRTARPARPTGGVNDTGPARCSNSSTSARVNPSSCARFTKRTVHTVPAGYARYPDGERGGFLEQAGALVNTAMSARSLRPGLRSRCCACPHPQPHTHLQGQGCAPSTPTAAGEYWARTPPGGDAMTGQRDEDTDAAPKCWCCGKDHPEERLVRLGAHPEVGVCLDCARWLHRRARRREDENRTGLAPRIRAGIDTVRASVICRGWHRRGVLGALLRRIDRHLP